MHIKQVHIVNFDFVLTLSQMFHVYPGLLQTIIK